MSFEFYLTIAWGLLAVTVIGLIAALVFLFMAIASWRQPNRKRCLLTSCGFFSLAAIAIATPQFVFKFVHFPTELTAENYEAIRDQMDAEVSTASNIMPGEIAPPFSVTIDAGLPFVLAKCKGSIVLINFFRTDCGPCNLEMPTLQKIWEEHRDRGDFRMIAISRGESRDEIASYKAVHKLTFPFAADADSSVYGLYASEGIPRTYLVDREGTLLFQSLGFMQSGEYDGDEEQIREMVANALEKHK